MFRGYKPHKPYKKKLHVNVLTEGTKKLHDKTIDDALNSLYEVTKLL